MLKLKSLFHLVKFQSVARPKEISLYNNKFNSFCDAKKGQIAGKDKKPKQENKQVKNENKPEKKQENTPKKEVKKPADPTKENQPELVKDDKLDDMDYNKNKSMVPEYKQKVPLKDEKYKIVHHYGQVDQKQKKTLDDFVTKMLREEAITQERSEEIKKELRNPLNNSMGRNLLDIGSLEDAGKYISNFSDWFFYKRTFDAMDRILRYQREQRDESNPEFQKIRSLDKLVKDSAIAPPKNPFKDMRQNMHSQDWLKEQPRLTQLNYNYNYEANREFTKKFPKYVEEDKKQTLEKHKLYKYMKLYPDSLQVKLRFIPKHLPDGVTTENIPDYPVDITGYKPAITKKSRRQYNRPKVDTEYKNYHVWRCLDRPWPVFDPEMDFLKVNLVPKNIIARFSVPGMPQHENITGLYYFEDENLDIFLLCDFKQTTDTWGENLPDEYYLQKEYDAKTNPDIKVPQKWPSYDEFWESSEEKEFRIYYPRYAEVKKLKRWLRAHINSFDSSKEKTMDQILDEKYGEVDHYTQYNKQRENTSIPAVRHYSPEFFMDKTEKRFVSHEPLVFPKYINPQEGEVFDYDEMLKEEAKKGLKREREKVAQ